MASADLALCHDEKLLMGFGLRRTLLWAAKSVPAPKLSLVTLESDAEGMLTLEIIDMRLRNSETSLGREDI